MVGRNEPCPCGSGKKYKKCCENNQQNVVQKVFLEEIEQVLQNFYNSYPSSADVKEYFQLVQTWGPTLKNHLQRDLIEAIALDDFFFHQRTDIWTNYLKRTKKKMIRPASIELLDQWAEPRAFIGQVEAVENQYLHATCTLTKKKIYIRRESNRPIPSGMQAFAFILPDGSGKENHYLAVSTFIFFPDTYQPAFESFAKQFDGTKQTPKEFFQANHLNFWKNLIDFGYSGEEYTPFEIEVVDLTKQFLNERGIESTRIIEILEDYLVEKKPKARKASAIAAGAIRYAQERELFEGVTLTVKEIAESFNVSASSLNKYYQELLQFDTVLV